MENWKLMNFGSSCLNGRYLAALLYLLILLSIKGQSLEQKAIDYILTNYMDSIRIEKLADDTVYYTGYTSGKHSHAFWIALTIGDYFFGVEDWPQEVLKDYYPDSVIDNFVTLNYLDSIDDANENKSASKYEIIINHKLFYKYVDSLIIKDRFRVSINNVILYRGYKYVEVRFSDGWKSIVCIVRFNYDAEPDEFWYKRWTS